MSQRDLRESLVRWLRPRMLPLTLIILAIIPFLIAACGGDDATSVPPATAASPTSTPAAPATPAPTTPPVVAPTQAPAVGEVRVEAGQSENLGTYLVDGQGMTLYLFTRDERNVSNCSGACAEAWPPLIAAGALTAGDGVDQERLTTVAREDGSLQVSYNGVPLYYYQADANPGDALGQDRGDVWYVVSTDGSAIRTTATVNVAQHPELGSMLADPSGRSLYLYTRDERNVTNCAGGCALAWPPVLTIEDPVAGDGLNQDRLTTIDRADGSRQVVYNGWPLYYFASDEKPGDALGQDRGDVWYVVSTDGGAIRTTATVNVAQHAELGSMLVDPSGRSLYLYTRDERNVTNCAGGCALAWPPVLTIEDPVAGDGLNQDRLTTIDRADGSRQVVYNGWPLYYFASDEKPGDALGQDRGTVWYVVSTDGGAVWSTATVTVADNAERGPILADLHGRTLYLYTRDTPGVSNCAGGCALAWPPLVSVGLPAAGEGVNGGLLGTIARDGGYNQVTYDGIPLYYFAADEKPGDSLGQDRGQVWYVITPSAPLLIALEEQNASGQAGWAKLSPWGDSTQVSLSLPSGNMETGLVHIHAGQCGADTLGGVEHALTSFEGGAGVSNTVVPVSLTALTTGGFAINSHQVSDASVYTSCGNLPGASDTVGIALSELNGSGQTGWVSLTARGTQTEVVVSATDGISQAQHIHEGSCDTLGGVAHPLTALSGGASMTTIDAELGSLRTGGFAVNLHKADDASVYTSCGNIPSLESSVALGAVKDNTLYDGTGASITNGAGEYLFAGVTRGGNARRALISFDIAASLPAGAVVSSAELSLNMSRSLAGDVDIALHRVLADWGEGETNASGNEGSGAAANSGDATWTHRSHGSQAWESPGGDFSAEPSAALAVGGLGRYVWQSTDRLVSDVQAWLSDQSTNFGWILIGGEGGTQTTKRFDSKENETAANRPVLTIVYAGG